jgi:hypothetical protein
MLKGISHTLDFLMPQYYNGVTRPVVDGFNSAGPERKATSDHYKAIVDNFFDGDATRILFGFCIKDCSGTGSNADGAQAAAVMEAVSDTYDCHGGAFVWVADTDRDASWSSTVNKAMDPNRGCSGAPVVIPKSTDPPSLSPTMTQAPTITGNPTLSPVEIPLQCCPDSFSGFRGFDQCRQ